MEKSLWVFVFLCSALLEVQSLECYICDNCHKVKLDQIQTCGPTTISDASTTMTAVTESPTTTTAAAKLSSSTSTTLKPTTIKATSAATTISSTITTEDITTSMKTIEVSTTTTTTKTPTTSTIETRPSTEFTTPAATSSTAAMEHTNTPIMGPAEPINSSTDAISTSSFNSATTEPQTINTPAEASTTTEPMTVTTITVNTAISSTTTFTEHTDTPKEEEEKILSEPVISSVTVTESSTAESVSFISTLPTTTTIESFSATESTIQNFSTMTTSSKPDAEPIIQNIPTLPTLTAGPIATFTTEPATKIPMTSAISYPESTVNNIRPNKQTNDTYNVRRLRSSSEGCACKKEQKCDCRTHERSKRYVLRGLGLSKEGVKYVCFVDKYKLNETEVIKRGCAIKEEEKNSCTKLGFGVNCKICDTDQCNGAAIIQSSILLMFTLYLILQ